MDHGAMLRSALRYIGKAPRIADYVTSQPTEAVLRIRAKIAELREKRGFTFQGQIDHDWEPRLHAMLNIPWPCETTSEFWTLWPRVIDALVAKRLQIGVSAFGGFNDGEPEIVRAVYCLVRHLKPLKVIETGVARGITSRFILEALERNGAGHLWSIDLPPPLNPELNAEVGQAVEGPCRQRWSYIRGSSRRCLPGLLSSLGEIDLFLHDSLHTSYNTRFELAEAWPVLRPGGAMVVDDIDLNDAFQKFEGRRRHPSLVCLANPLQTDRSRFADKGVFGIIVK